MKKILIALLVPIFLTGCLGSDGNSITAGFREYVFDDEKIAISVPENFLQITDRELPDGSVAAFADVDRAVPGFTANVNITKSTISPTIPSRTYANLNIARAGEILNNYNLISNREVEISGHQTSIHFFEITEAETARRIQQTYLVRGNTAYTITAIMSSATDENLEDIFRSILTSFRFVE